MKEDDRDSGHGEHGGDVGDNGVVDDQWLETKPASPPVHCLPNVSSLGFPEQSKFNVAIGISIIAIAIIVIDIVMLIIIIGLIAMNIIAFGITCKTQ